MATIKHSKIQINLTSLKLSFTPLCVCVCVFFKHWKSESSKLSQISLRNQESQNANPSLFHSLNKHDGEELGLADEVVEAAQLMA